MSARRALFFSFLDRYAALALSIASSIVVARLLSPAELGVFSVTMVLIGFIAAMRDLGAGQYLVQTRELDEQSIRAVWTVLLGMGGLMACAVLLLAYPLAWFYEQDAITAIMVVIAANFLINPFGSITYAWLMREMRFDALAAMRFGSSLAGAATSIYLAWSGHGPISLAWGNFAATLVNACLALGFRPKAFSWLPSIKGVRKVISFGTRISGTSLVANIGSGAPEMFLGKLQGMASAGLYSRSNGLATMFHRLLLDAIQSVATPLFARAVRASEDVSIPFLRAVSYVTALGWSFLFGLALMSLPLTRLLYGHQWDDSASLTRLLAIGMAVSLPSAMCAQLMTAAGHAGQLLRTMARVVFVQVCFVAAGAYFGLMEAGVGYVIAQFYSVQTWFRSTQRCAPYDRQALLRVLVHSLTLAIITSTAPVLTVLYFGIAGEAVIPPLLTATLGGAAMFILGARTLGHPIYEELRLVAHRIARRGSA